MPSRSILHSRNWIPWGATAGGGLPLLICILWGAISAAAEYNLPQGYPLDEVKHQRLNFTPVDQKDERTLVYCQFPEARLTAEPPEAVSFPHREMERTAELAPCARWMDWFSASKLARLICGILFMTLFAWIFFRFSSGTGLTLFFLLAIALGCTFYYSPEWQLIALPLAVILLGINEWLLTRRRMQYMPPIMQIEGGGIKRGLTAPESAVLLELPLAKVLMLVIFGMLKKGILRQVQAEPLRVELDPAFVPPPDAAGDETQQHRFFREAAQKQGVVLHSYEQPFLFLLQSNPGVPVKEIPLAVPMRKLIEGTAARMAGFDLSDTQDYCRRIVRRATEQAAALGDASQREAVLDRNFEWILMDDNYSTVFDSGRPYWPIWARGGSLGGGPSTVATPSAPSIPGQTAFSDAAASFSGWTENTLGGFASAIAPEALSPSGAAAGLRDLCGDDRVTGDLFKSLTEASISGGGSGGGGGCACACAGCACACACASGGR